MHESPNEYHHRLREIKSQLRSRNTVEGREAVKCTIEPQGLEQIKEFLNTQQECVKILVDTRELPGRLFGGPCPARALFPNFWAAPARPIG